MAAAAAPSYRLPPPPRVWRIAGEGIATAQARGSAASPDQYSSPRNVSAHLSVRAWNVGRFAALPYVARPVVAHGQR
jgi:hypothetical protein